MKDDAGIEKKRRVIIMKANCESCNKEIEQVFYAGTPDNELACSRRMRNSFCKECIESHEISKCETTG